MDPITDILRTMHVTAFGQHRVEATAPWGLINERQSEEKSHLPAKNFPHRFGARHGFARQLLAERGRDSGADSPHRW